MTGVGSIVVGFEAFICSVVAGSALKNISICRSG